MTPSQVMDAAELCLRAKRPAFLHGSPGVGKSRVLADLAAKLKYKLIDVRAGLLDPVDLRGIPIIEGGLASWTPPSFFPRQDDKGKYILFLDELNAAPPLVQAACYQLILDRKVGDYVLPDNVVMFAAGNKDTDRAVTSRMPSALANRFVHIDFDVDLDDWMRWAFKNDVNSEVIAFLRYRPGLLHDFKPERNEKAFPSPRSWEFVSDIKKVPGGKVTLALISGIVGPGAATEFDGFLKVYRNLPDPEEVLKNPTTAEVPNDPATLYALTTAISQRIKPENMKNAIKYLERLPAEFSVLCINFAVMRDESLVSEASFLEWARANKDVLV